MSTLTPQTTVQSGRYIKFTTEEIAAEWVKYKTAVQALGDARVAGAGGTITMISQNGKQVQFSPAEAEQELLKWRQELTNAENQLLGEYEPHLDRTAARFS